MTEFLNWIYAQASKIYYWFGSQYASAVQVVNYAWSWSVTQARQAYSDARAIAEQWFNDALSFARAVEQELFGWVGSLINSINIAVQGVYDWVRPLLDGINADWRSWIDYVRFELYRGMDGLTSWANTLVSGSRDSIMRFVVEWVDVLQARIAAITKEPTELTGLDLGRLYDLVQRQYETLVVFVSDPARFILDVIEPMFLTWVSRLLAYALGTTKEELP